MDYRCLYGHRTPASYSFAIEQGICPMCGAPIVSVVGYQIARKLASTVPLDPVVAFNTMRELEKDYELVAKVPDEDEAEVSMAEIEIDEAEVETTNVEPEPEPEPAVVEAAPEENGAELPSEEQPPPPVTDAPVEDSLSDVEKDFFASGEEASP